MPPAQQPPERRRRKGAIWWIAAGVVVVIAAGAIAFVLARPANASEVLLQAASEPGPNPYTPSLESGQAAEANPSQPVPALTAKMGNSTVQLYGGTGQLTKCDKKMLIDFLAANPAKAAAWAAVERISVSQIPAFIDGLVEVVTQADIRVTNHGYENGRATGFQAVLQAGTALLVDANGAPRVRCKCGNPLSDPVRLSSPTYTGTRWPGFQPTLIVVVIINVQSPPIAGPTTTPTTEPPATPVETPSPRPPPTVNLSLGAVASASSVFSSQYPASLGIDGNPTTSWFSSGPGASGTSSFTVVLPKAATIVRVGFVGNLANAIAANRVGFGYGFWTIDLYGSGGRKLFTLHSTSPATSNQSFRLVPLPGVLKAVFTGHDSQSRDCGGLGELDLFGYFG